MTLKLKPKPKPSKKGLAQPSEHLQASFNIYARPFVPRSLTVINTLPGCPIYTYPRKGIQYDAYADASFGPISGHLPRPPVPHPHTAATARGQAVLSLAVRHYEAFFHHHLHHEIKAQHLEVEACALYGHQVDIMPPADSLDKGHTICTLQVPGLRENSPFVEEDDIVQLRQLVYEDGKNILCGMAEWLRLKDVFEFNQLQTHPWQDNAPGWTQIVYHARVLGVVRATETLHLRVAGLPLGRNPTPKFNVQFAVPYERNVVSSPPEESRLSHHSDAKRSQWSLHWRMLIMLFPTVVG